MADWRTFRWPGLNGTELRDVYRGRYSEAVSPPTNDISGGATVTIRGVNLGSGSDITNVTLCGAAVSAIQSQSRTEVVVTAGAGLAPGTGAVVVYSTSYGTTTAQRAFAYTAPPLAVTITNPAECPCTCPP